jgi:L-serine dehydratase
MSDNISGDMRDNVGMSGVRDPEAVSEWTSLEELVVHAEKAACSLSEVVLRQQVVQMEASREDLMARMRQRLSVMREGVETGLSPDLKSLSGLSGGNAHRLQVAHADGRLAADSLTAGLMVRAMAMSEANAAMGCIVACPTAGSCGIVPAVLLTLQQERDFSDDALVMALFNTAGIGLVIARNAFLAGAQGGCQAECGSAAAMAASAAVELLGGTPRMCIEACAFALKSVLGLVCDPVAGLVEVPCVKRNVSGAVNAMTAANLALAGIRSVIPPDEVVAAMRQIGESMPKSLKETAAGGLAATPTGQRIAAELGQNDAVGNEPAGLR